MISNEALALRTSNARIFRGETRRERRTTGGRNLSIISRGPAVLRQVKAGVGRRTGIVESAAAGDEAQNQIRPDGVVVVDSEGVGLVLFRAFISAQAGPEGVQRQIQQV